MTTDENKDITLSVIDGHAINTAGTHYTYTGDDSSLIGTTTTTSTFVIQTQRELKDVKFIENDEGNFMEIIYKETQNYGGVTTSIYSGFPVHCMVKERYGVMNGKMQLIKTIRGTESPGYYVQPTINWEE